MTPRTTWTLAEKGMESPRDHIDIKDDDGENGENGAEDGGDNVDVGGAWGTLETTSTSRGNSQDGEDDVDVEGGAWGAPETTLRTTTGAARTAAGTTWTSGEKGVGSSTAAVPR